VGSASNRLATPRCCALHALSDYDQSVEGSDHQHGWLPRSLRGLEHRLGARRDDRTLWVWLVPVATLVITFVVLAFIGMAGSVDLALTIPMALVLSVFLGALSAFYLTAASSDEHDRDDDDRRRPPSAPPTDPPARPGARVVSSSPTHSGARHADERVPATAGDTARH
jgi:hypothetical protein